MRLRQLQKINDKLFSTSKQSFRIRISSVEVKVILVQSKRKTTKNFCVFQLCFMKISWVRKIHRSKFSSKLVWIWLPWIKYGTDMGKLNYYYRYVVRFDESQIYSALKLLVCHIWRTAIWISEAKKVTLRSLLWCIAQFTFLFMFLYHKFVFLPSTRDPYTDHPSHQFRYGSQNSPTAFLQVHWVKKHKFNRNVFHSTDMGKLLFIYDRYKRITFGKFAMQIVL